jgi:hypothetical protein
VTAIADARRIEQAAIYQLRAVALLREAGDSSRMLSAHRRRQLYLATLENLLKARRTLLLQQRKGTEPQLPPAHLEEPLARLTRMIEQVEGLASTAGQDTARRTG